MEEDREWTKEERDMVFQVALDKQEETIELLCDLLTAVQEKNVRELLENILDKLSCMSHREFYQFVKENRKKFTAEIPMIRDSQ